MTRTCPRRNFIAHVRDSDGADQLVPQHLLETAELAGEFGKKIGLEDAASLQGLLHDFGKFSESFYLYLSSAKGRIDPDSDDYIDPVSNKGKIDHSTAGAQLIWERLRIFGSGGQGELCAQILALGIASHHSGLIDCLSPDGQRKFHKRMAKPGANLEECLDNADPAILEQADRLFTPETVASIFKKVVDVGDLSREGGETTVGAFALGMLTRFLFSCLVDADRLNSAEFERPWEKQIRRKKATCFDWATAIERLETYLANLESKHPIDSLRTEISANCLERSKSPQSIFTLTVPTGGGKTFASLRFALHHASQHKLDRVVYVIPYTSIIEQNATAVRTVLEQEGDPYAWVLEHHSNLEPEQLTWQAKLVSENWDSPVVFVTMVQVLETLFGSGTRSVRRMHNLAKAVLIFDEIQTIPLRCVHLFCNALNFLTQHAGTTALLCTATQPVLDQLKDASKGQLTLAQDAELVRDKEKLFRQLSSRVEIRDRTTESGWTESDIAELGLDHIEHSGSCLIVTNTKQWAQALYTICAGRLGHGEVFHLSTNMCPVHRKRALDEIRKRLASKQLVLCISTQLIEAGVDISFAAVIRFLAGLDSIAQAAGRCNRHGELNDSQGRPAMGTVDIVNPCSEHTSRLVDIVAGQGVTRRILKEEEESGLGGNDPGRLLSPSVIRRYFEYYFHGRRIEMVYPLSDNPTHGNNLLDQLSVNGMNVGSMIPPGSKNERVPLLRQSFMSAAKAFKVIEAPTEAVIVPYGKGAEIIRELCSEKNRLEHAGRYAALKRAQQFSINVFPHVFQALWDDGALTEVQPGAGVYCLDERFYSEEFGVALKPVRPMGLLEF